MKLIDTHTHVSFKAYEKDMLDVIKRSLDDDIYMVTVGTQSDTNKKAIDVAESHDGIWAAIGVHPIHIDAGTQQVPTANFDEQELGFQPRNEKIDKEQMLQMAAHPKVVAIGECGLDYYRIDAAFEKQIKEAQAQAFLDQMEVAAKANLPLIIHCRDAYEDQEKLVKMGADLFGYTKPGVMHCFTGTYEHAKLFLDLGWYISFSGIAAFAKNVGEVAAKVPLHRIVIETDAPYLTPPPHRGKRNEPAYVKFVAESIAAQRGIPLEEFAQATYENAIKLFNLPLK